jgi:hypothetical protein
MLDLSLFLNNDRTFVVTIFIQNEILKKNQNLLEKLGESKNIKLTIQPCHYEAIEFLYHISDKLSGHFRSLERDVFWEALELKKNTPEEVVDIISSYHYEYLCAILKQDINQIKILSKNLLDLSSNFIKPLKAEEESNGKIKT